MITLLTINGIFTLWIMYKLFIKKLTILDMDDRYGYAMALTSIISLIVSGMLATIAIVHYLP